MKLDNTNYKHNNKRKTESQCAGYCHLGVLLTKIIVLITESKRKKKDRKKKDSGKTLSFEGVGIPVRSRIQKRIKTPERRQLSV